ncbi:MAG: HU family DNA-binding protein [Pirellulales bacterium]
MTKKEIVRTISDKTGLPQIQIKEIVELTLEGIVETLLDVGRVELRDFGVFQVKTRKARRARNPRTGHEVDVPEKSVVTFKPGKEMEARVKLADEKGLVERLRGMVDSLDADDDDEDDTDSSGVRSNKSDNTPG